MGRKSDLLSDIAGKAGFAAISIVGLRKVLAAAGHRLSAMVKQKNRGEFVCPAKSASKLSNIK